MPPEGRNPSGRGRGPRRDRGRSQDVVADADAASRHSAVFDPSGDLTKIPEELHSDASAVSTLPDAEGKTAGVEKNPKAEEASALAAPAGKMFSMAEPFDYLLMAVGSIGAFGHGLVLPGLMIVFGGMVNALGEYRGDPDENSKMAARIAHLSIFSFAFACSTIVTSTLQVGCWIYTGERQAVKLRSQVLRVVLRQDVGYFDTESQTAAIVGHISSDIAIIQDGTSDKIGHLVQHMSTFISGLAVGFIYAWKLSLLTVATVPAIALVGAVYNKVAVSLSAESQEAYGQATSVVEQAVTQIRAVYSYVEESSAIKALSRALESTVSIGTRAGLAKGLGIGSLTAAVNCSWSLLLWYAGVLVSKGESTGGRVITAVFSIIFGGMSLGIAAPDFQAFAQARVVAYKIFLLLDRKPLVEEAKDAKRLKKVTGRIEFFKVSFAYPSRPESLVLNNLSLYVPAGKVVALVGGSGSGKSTVISLIERFYDPTAGEILLDGVDTKQLQLKWLRNQIGLVSQEPSLFATSIRDNIAYGKAAGSAEATVTDDAIEGAAKAANAHSFITKLPLGYQSQVGERGFQLSGGQKQRLAIARAILRNPTILLLDEATSALDTESERVVQEALDSLMLGRTTLVVAHRLATIRNADMIAVMQLGQLVELGSHKELMEIDNGVYKAMVLTQQNAGDMAPRRVAQSPARHSFSQHSSLAGSPAHGYGQPARRSFAGSSGLAPPRRSFAAASPLPGYSPSAFVSRMSPAPAMPFSPASISVTDFSMAFSPGSMTPSHRRRMSLAESEMQEKPGHRYSGLELEAEKEDAYGGGHEPQGKSASASLLLRLFRLSLPSWPYTVLGSIGSVMAGAMMPLFIYYLFEVTVAFFDPDTHSMKKTIQKWIIVYAGLGMGSLLGNALEHYSFGRVGEAVTKRVQEDMFAAMLDFEVGWFDQEENNSGAILSRFSSDAMSIKTAVADRAAQVVQNLAAFTVAIVVGLFTEWHMVLLAIGCLPFYLFGGITMIQSMSGFSGKLSKQHEEANKVAAEAVNNFRTVISFSAEDQVMGRFNKVLEGPTKKGLGRSAKVGAIFGFSQFSLHASSALSLWFCSVLVQKKLSSFLHALQTFQSLSQTAYSLAEVMTLLPAMVQAGQALASVFSIIDRQLLPQGMDSESAGPGGSKGKKKLSEVKSHIQPSDVQLSNPTRPDVLSKGKKKLSEVKGHIQLFDVQLSYPTRPDVLVLRGLSLKIQAGRTTALVGESGSGKSSVIALIERFYEPSFGYLTLDGRDISTLDVRWLRTQIGLVQQEPALFQMSIRDNILYGCGEAGKAEAEVVAAAKMANAHAFISALPQGYHTPVGTRGVQLSGGQKQRIAIARAVLKAPKILLLDEATSALDVESERLVQEALWQLMSSGRHTTVVVAHRLSTVRNSNAIAVLRDGVLDQIGTHDDLMASKGTYARLIRAQT